MGAADSPVWWKLKGEERAQAVVKVTDSLQRYQYQRLMRARRNLSMYEDRRLNSLHPAAYLTDGTQSDYHLDQFDYQRLQLARNIVNTAVAKVAGKQKPKASFCVNENDWRTKRRAMKLERFVEAIKASRQGGYNDAWEVLTDAFCDSCIFDCGVIKVWADTGAKRVRIDRRLPWEVFFDPAETKGGNPRNVFDCYGFDREELIERFPKHADAIATAKSLAEDSRGQEDNWVWGDEAGRQVKVREAYRLKLSEDKPGRRSLIVNGVDLLDEEEGEYWRDDFPYLWLTWERNRLGTYGNSIVDGVYWLNVEVNAEAQRQSDKQRLCSSNYFIFEEGSIEEKDLDSNEIGVRLRVKPGSTVPPQLVTPSAISESDMAYQDRNKQFAFEVSGVSYSAATGNTDPGVTAAIAMRQKENQATERFAIPWRMVETVGSVGLARKIIACAKEIAEVEPGFAITWVQDRSAKELRWSDVEIDLPDEAIQVDSVSGLVNTPTDRLQLASELHDRKLITDEAYLEVIQAKGISAEIDRRNGLSRWLDKQIDAWLDYEAGDEEDPSKFRYRPPLKWIGIDGLTECLMRAGREYLEQDADDCPDEKLGWFIKFITDADAMIAELVAKQAALQAAQTSGSGAAVQALQAPAPAPAPAPGAP